VVGDSDNVVPYVENGKLLYEYYVEQGEDVTLIVKKAAGHHPHGLADNEPLRQFVSRVYS